VIGAIQGKKISQKRTSLLAAELLTNKTTTDSSSCIIDSGRLSILLNGTRGIDPSKPNVVGKHFSRTVTSLPMKLEQATLTCYYELVRVLNF